MPRANEKSYKILETIEWKNSAIKSALKIKLTLKVFYKSHTYLISNLSILPPSPPGKSTFNCNRKMAFQRIQKVICLKCFCLSQTGNMVRRNRKSSTRWKFWLNCTNKFGIEKLIVVWTFYLRTLNPTNTRNNFNQTKADLTL